ncbi:MAG: ATP-binding domain-containing protein, partial [Alistipes sp.]|nr:ATP-binding domain-containing protein [Alistipes sp.]
IEEWMQGVMLMTDMDNDNPEDRNKVTLITVHSAKGWEYKSVYIVGMEENLFPSQRAIESPEGFEEERRLFYVALTRAKVAATLSYAESRFKWGNMEFSRPSCFLREIDPCYVEIADGEDHLSRPSRSPRSPFGEEPTHKPGSNPAIEELRRRFDYRFQQKQQGGSAQRIPPGHPLYAKPAQPRTSRPFPEAASAPKSTPTPPPTAGLRRVESRPAGGVTPPSSPCQYTVGERVEHPKFGAGTIRRIETLAQDHKLVVEFGDGQEKTLLAKFAKLTKL